MLPKLLRAEKDKVVERKNNMSKYNLTDILNEYIGGGRIGTLRISYKDLVDKMDELEKSGKVIVREKGSSADGKVNREFEVVDRDSAVPGGRKQERGFTVYDYKFGFDPGDQDNFTEEYDFSVGGNDLQLAMDLIDGVKPYRFEENIKEDEFDEARQAAIESSQRAAGIKEGYIGDENYEDQKGTADQKLWVLTKLIDAGILKNPSSEYTKALKAVEHPDADEAAKSMRENINEGDLFSSEFDRAELKDIINDLNKDLILDMPTRRAYKFLVSLLDKQDKEEMGLNEQMYIDDEEFEMEMGRSKKDSLKKEMMIHIDQLIDGNIDMNDFMNVVEDIMAEVNSMKEVMGVDRKGKKKPDSEDGMISKAKKSMKENGDVNDYLDELSEAVEVMALLDKIRKHLKGSDRNFLDKEIEAYIESLKRDIKQGEFDGVESASMEDHEEDLLNYIADRSLQEHFKRFM